MITTTCGGLELNFFSMEDVLTFSDSDEYLLFIHERDGWCFHPNMFDGSVRGIRAGIEGVSDFKARDLRIAQLGFSRRRYAIYHRQKLFCTNVPELMPDHTTCSKCKSKKIEYVGLGVGSSQTELICPKCG